MPDGYTIMSAISDSKKTTAKMMVMRSRFFSTILVPVSEGYTQLAIGDARALSGVQENEDDETQAGDDQQGDEDDQKRIHVMLFHSK